MNVIKNTLSLIAFLTFCHCAKAQYIQVDDTYTAQQLVENVLINSPCANVSNFTVSGGSFGTGQQSYGYFNSGTSGFPFANGIVLSTARAKLSEGPNMNVISDGGPVSVWGGDADLEQAIGISNTLNSTILEFDFVPLTSSVSFDYIFASEEYHGSATCTYSDGFAFLLRQAGTSGPYQNLAVIPNTNSPVLVTSVHPEIPGSCAAQNEQYFGSFNGQNHPINYNGETKPLTARATVTPGLTYHIKLVIADHMNYQYDSAVFLSGGSFKVGTDLGPDRLLATRNPLCAGETYTLEATEAGSNSYKWFKDTIQIPGATGSTYAVTQPGTYAVEVTMGSTSCIATGQVKIEYAALPVLTNTTLVQCDENSDNIALFNLTRADDLVKNGQPDLGAVSYYENLIDAQAQNGNFITNPIGYSSAPGMVYASVSNSYGCINTATVQLQISNNSVANFPLLETCDLDPDPVQDGYYHFTLSDADPQVLAGLPAGLVVEYYESINDALLHQNVLPNVFTNTVQNDQTIFAKIVNGPDCYDILAVNLVVNTLAPPDFEDEHISLCGSASTTLSVNDIYVTYTWSNGDTDHATTVTTPGIYTITVTENGCSATKTFIVTTPPPPIIEDVQIQDMTPADNTVLILYSGSGTYEFSLDGINFQDSPFFDAVETGQYMATVRDKNGCGSASQKITVLNFPRYFTPNGDGYNDHWVISSLKEQPNAIVNIFDRYGKLLCQFKGDSSGWNGKLNTRDLPSDDYWFVMTLENGKSVKGHFSLKR